MTHSSPPEQPQRPDPSPQLTPPPNGVASDPPPQDLAGPIPMATVLTYAPGLPSLDPSTHRWLTFAGVLWCITSLAPAFIAFLLAEDIRYRWNIRVPFRRSPDAWALVCFTATSAACIWMGISCLRYRGRILSFAPALAMHLLTASLLLILLFALYIPSVLNLFMTAALLVPPALLTILCMVHLRSSILHHVRSIHSRSRLISSRALLNEYLLLWAITIALISAGYCMVGTWSDLSRHVGEEVTNFSIVILIGSALLAWLTWTGRRIAHILAIALYSLAMLMVYLYWRHMIDYGLYGRSVATILLGGLILLHTLEFFHRRNLTP